MDISIIGIILLVAFFIATIYIVVKLNQKIKSGDKSNDELTNGEKIFTILAGFFIPIIAVQGIMYYGLKKKYPKKAKQANTIGWIMFLAVIVYTILKK